MSEDLDIPRRIRLDMFTPAEKAIYDAVGVVEQAGAHPLLTDAVILLGQAREKVADYVDSQIENSPKPFQAYCTKCKALIAEVGDEVKIYGCPEHEEFSRENLLSVVQNKLMMYVIENPDMRFK